MIVMVILSVFAAFGLLCVLWVCLGFLLPGQQGVHPVLVCYGQSVDAALRRHRWLRDIGISRGPLILVDAGMPEDQRQMLENRPDIEICTPAQLYSRVE